MAEVLAALKAADVIVLASPVYFYNLGRGDKARQSKLFRISVWALGVTGVAVTTVSYLFGGPAQSPPWSESADESLGANESLGITN